MVPQGVGSLTALTIWFLKSHLQHCYKVTFFADTHILKHISSILVSNFKLTFMQISGIQKMNEEQVVEGSDYSPWTVWGLGLIFSKVGFFFLSEVKFKILACTQPGDCTSTTTFIHQQKKKNPPYSSAAIPNNGTLHRSIVIV